MHLDCNWTAKFRSQWTGHKEPSTISATVAGPVGGHLQAGTEDAPVLNHLASLRRLHDSGATYPDLLYLHACNCFYSHLPGLLPPVVCLLKGLKWFLQAGCHSSCSPNTGHALKAKKFKAELNKICFVKTSERNYTRLIAIYSVNIQLITVSNILH